jgi:glycosyltransferase involved in cell wall biosynthesis
MTRICLIPKVHGVGGMVSFQAKLTAGLAARGIQVCTGLAETPYEAVLVTGGTRDLPGLGRARRRGVRIVQRLDGINWLHRRQRTGLRHYLRAESGNLLLTYLRSRLATHIVYQSAFVQGWWEGWFGAAPRPSAVIHNGVDLGVYTPDGPYERPAERRRLLVVEGSLGGGYDMGLTTAVRLAELLADQGFPLELMVVGQVAQNLWAAAQARSRVPLLWAGRVPREQIPGLDRSAHLLYSADLNAACPNSVIEALACGLPVVAFDTGALPELVTGDSGRVVPYGADPWKLEPPDLPALAAAAAGILSDGPRFRLAARAHAVESFGLDRMVERYLEVLLGG